MTTTRTSRALGLATLTVLGVLGAQPAMAQQAGQGTGWYGGASAGRSSANIDDARINSSLLGAGFTSTSITDSDRSTGYKLYGGYRLNPYLALEGGYFDLGDFGYKATTVPAGTLNGNIKLRGLNLDVVGIWPITDKFEAFARVGAAYAQARDRFSGTGAVSVTNPNPRKNDTNLKLGLGLGYNFSESLGMRVEAERYRVNDAVGNKGDVDLLSVGLVYRFGARAQAPVPRAAVYVPPPAPQPVVVAVAPVPPPAPQPAPPAPPVAPMRVSFSADSLFDFDKSVIKPAGQQSLDKFAQDLKGANYDAVTVTGHTDRLGPHDYNLKLSARRAEAVSAYLVQPGGVPAAKIAAKGVNGANPVTKPADCPGRTATPALIACLQPDRRVEVEVSGTR